MVRPVSQLPNARRGSVKGRAVQIRNRERVPQRPGLARRIWPPIADAMETSLELRAAARCDGLPAEASASRADDRGRRISRGVGPRAKLGEESVGSSWY